MFKFHSLYVAVQVSQHHLLKILSFLHCIFLSLSEIDCRCVGLFLVSLFCSIDLCVCFCACAVLFFDCYSLVVYFDVRECVTSSSVLFSQDCFGYLGSFWFHINFRIICSSSVKNVLGILIGIALNL